MMIVAALLTVVLGGFGVVSAQTRPFDFDQRRSVTRLLYASGDGGHRGSAPARHADHPEPGRSGAPSPTTAPQDRLVSPGEAARRAQHLYGGRVLSVELARDGAPYYRIKLLSNGNVRVVRIPAGR